MANATIHVDVVIRRARITIIIDLVVRNFIMHRMNGRICIVAIMDLTRRNGYGIINI